MSIRRLLSRLGGFFHKLRSGEEKQYLAKCGHLTSLKGTISVFGKTSEGELGLGDDGKVTRCIKCLETMVIPCAWCGELIFPGDPITLYTPSRADYVLREGTVVYKKEPLQLVGCLRWDCAETGADRSGFWIAPGKVQRVLSPLEKVLMTGDVVIEGDLTDPARATPVND